MAKKVYQENLTNFPQLKLTNSSESGKKLLEVFDNLGINKASINKRVIEAWFDTDCDATKEMLEWFTEYVDENNVLTAYENYKYEGLHQLNESLSEKHYNSALSELIQNKPGILNYDENCFEIEYLEGELEMVLEEKQHLDQVLNLNECLATKLAKELNKLEEEDVAYCSKKKEAEEECTQLTMEIEETHKKLEAQINFFAQQLYQNQNAKSNTIAKIYSGNVDVFHKLPPLDLFLKRERDNYSDVNVTTKSARKRLLHDKQCDSVNELDVLMERINKSIQKYVQMEVAYERKTAELNFLKTLNIHNFVINNLSSQMTIESNIISHELAVQNSFDVLQVLAKQIANSFVIKPKLDTLRNIKQMKEQKLDRYEKAHSKVIHIMANRILLYLLLNKEVNDIKTTDAFLKDVHHYITTVLHNCHSRIDEMLKVINSDCVHKQMPLEEKLEIFKFQRRVLLGDRNDSTSLIDLMRNFMSEYNNVNQQIFFLDLNNHRIITKNFEKCITDRRKMLANGPTSQIEIIPRDIYNWFDQIKETVDWCASSVKLSVQTINDSDKKLSHKKWFKIRRQLWMWFIAEPKKLLLAIKHIESSSKQSQN